MSDEQDDPNPPSPEYQAFLDDLKQYSNPEVFDDASLPQIYKLHIINMAVPDLPAILNIEVNGDVLPDVLYETTALIVHKNRSNSDEDLSAVRAELLADEDYLEAEQEMRRFFIRHLPKLMVRIYDITVLMAILSSAKHRADQSQMRDEFEQAIKIVLNTQTQTLKREIKQMVGTRSSGRPKKFETAALPLVVKQDVDVALVMMGDARGKDAVPGLKGIALNLNTNDQALGKQLSRCGYLWSQIRTYLENLPPDET